MVLESHIGLKEEFGQALDKVLALAHSAKQLVIFIDVAEELVSEDDYLVTLIIL